MKIENYIVFCLIVFFTLTDEQIKTLRITNLNPNHNTLEKSSINFSAKNEANNLINSIKQNSSFNSQLNLEKNLPPTFSRSFTNNPKLANGEENAQQQQYYAELLKQIQKKKQYLENLSKTGNIANFQNSVQPMQQRFLNQNFNRPNLNNNINNNNVNLQAQGLNKLPQINPTAIENLIVRKIDSTLANTNLMNNMNNLNSIDMQNQNRVNQAGQIALRNNNNNKNNNNNGSNNFSIMQLANENALKESLTMKFTNTTKLQFDEVKTLMFEAQKRIISENKELIEKMKDKILNEIKPILKTIADMQFFTYKKIKNVENSFGKLKDFHPENKTIEDLNDPRIPNYDEDSSEVGKLAKLSTMPEVDDLSNFGIEDAKSDGKFNVGKNLKGKGKEENFVNNNKVKYNRNIRKTTRGGKDLDIDNTHSEEIKKVIKNDKYNDP